MGDASGEGEIRDQLERILASRAFQASDRCRRFLRFIVEEALAGRGERIKAYAIAIEVYGRDQSFDAQGDPLVRLEAGRLRRALEHYYLTDGSRDPVEITIPKGRYQPQFALRDHEGTPSSSPATEPELGPAPRAGRSPMPARILVMGMCAVLAIGIGLASLWWLRSPAGGFGRPFRPSVLVMPLAGQDIGPDEYRLALGVTDQIIAELSRFREIVVYGRGLPVAADADPDGLVHARELGASHLLGGSVSFAGSKARVYVRLDASASGATVWSATFDRDLNAEDMFAVQDQIATEVATRIAQPYGEIARTGLPAGRHPSDISAYRCAIDFYAYRRTLARDEQPKIVDCLQRTLVKFPDYATGWAMLAMTWVDNDRFNFPAAFDAPAALDRAVAAAQRAIQLDPSDVRAWQALMLASYLRSDTVGGRVAGERALSLNPNDLEVVGEFGMRLAMSGEWERGAAMIRSVLDRDPAGARFHLAILALDSVRTGHYEEALELLDRMGSVSAPAVEMIRAAVLGQLGRAAEARAVVKEVERNVPDMLERLESEFDKRNLQVEVRAVLLEGWRKAGIALPSTSTRLQPPRP